MSTCPTGKRGYDDHSLAVEALIGAHVAYNYGESQGPRGVYCCDDCGYFHLTSKGAVNPRLEKMLKEGEIKKLREAGFWEGKFKKR